MIGRRNRQSSLFYVAFGKQASLIKDDLLEPIDALLDDDELIERVAEALGKRRPRSRTTGRRGIAPDRLLRCAVLKQIKGWSLRELERELRSSLVYRRFTRFDEDAIPKYSTFCRSFAAVDEDTIRRIHTSVVERAKSERVAKGAKLRTDTTVVESNVHYPTDSTLLQDGIRVLTRNLHRIAEQTTKGSVKVVERSRAAKHRVLEIARAAKSFTATSRAQFKDSYGKLAGIARSVVRQAETLQKRMAAGQVPIVGKVTSVLFAQLQLDHFLPLVKGVIAQTKARVFGGDTHVVDKILSIFEPHTQVIRKGKAHKPTEFGRLVRIDEVEGGIISNYDVKDGNPADVTDFVPAVLQHKAIFGRPPQIATADRGFYSAKNEREAGELGVKRVALPARGPLSSARRKIQKQRWFQRALRWRSGIEARIGTAKHRYGMNRARSKGDRGFKRDVGWSIITNNLVTIARVNAKRKAKNDAQAAKRPP